MSSIPENFILNLARFCLASENAPIKMSGSEMMAFEGLILSTFALVKDMCCSVSISPPMDNGATTTMMQTEPELPQPSTVPQDITPTIITSKKSKKHHGDKNKCVENTNNKSGKNQKIKNKSVGGTAMKNLSATNDAIAAATSSTAITYGNSGMASGDASKQYATNSAFETKKQYTFGYDFNFASTGEGSKSKNFLASWQKLFSYIDVCNCCATSSQSLDANKTTSVDYSQTGGKIC